MKGKGGRAAWRMEQCVAICDYTAVSDREISFHRGDVITVLGKGDEGGYWEGFTNGQTLDQQTGKKIKTSQSSTSSSFSYDESASFGGGGGGGGGMAKRGLFPTCFVSSNLKAHIPPLFCDAALALYDYRPQTPAELEMRKYDLITGVKPSSTPGWWLGINETSKLRKSSGSPSSSSPQPKLFPLRFVTCHIVRVIAPFSEPTNARALSIQTGDIIQVLHKLDDGWWEGIQCSSVVEHPYSRPICRGRFPSNLIVPNVPTTMPAMFCSRCRTCFDTSAVGGIATTKASMFSCAVCKQEERITTELLKSLNEESAKEEGADGPTRKKVEVFKLLDRVEKQLGVTYGPGPGAASCESEETP